MQPFARKNTRALNPTLEFLDVTLHGTHVCHVWWWWWRQQSIVFIFKGPDGEVNGDVSGTEPESTRRDVDFNY